MKIVCLVEDKNTNSSLLNEHGLSLYIETQNKKILFDTGKTDDFMINAKQLGIDLKTIDFVVISHGHYDHGGGVSAFLEENNTALVYINKYAFEEYYHGIDKYIGLDKRLLDNKQIVLLEGNYKITDNICLYSGKEQKNKYSINSNGLSVKRDNILEDDDFNHEQYLQINEKGKQILISGCSHKGILNIMDWFSPDVFVGGLHLNNISLDADRKALENIRDILYKYNTKYYTCHCTGISQYEFLKNKLDKNILYLSTGEEINL